ncbi:hypothetical protein [Rufibacter roseolus]|uniref:hypothetical protein n=1 Tax=Rufibacter roseolus TaxID=2817375 RepID=UPI001B3111AE|nr:hypothetical protein [Rufibacter roseolus]
MAEVKAITNLNRLYLLWPYLWLAVITLVIFPYLTGLVVTLLNKPDAFAGKPTFDFTYFEIVRGTTLFYGTWSFLLFVQVPYSLFCTTRRFKRKSILVKFALFYALLVLMGLLVPDGSVIDFFMDDKYPKAWFLYFALAIVLCPLVNFALAGIAKNSAPFQKD